MIYNFESEESRIFIFNEKLTCHFCSCDIFIPYETYTNVEKPGIKVIFVHNTAICTHCGYVIEFGDPSHYDEENNTYIWALGQQLIHEKPAIEPAIPTLDEKTKEEYKKCIDVALQLLIQENKATDDLLTLFNEECFLDMAKSLDPKFEIEYPHMITRHCLVTLLSSLMNYNIVDSDQLIRILQYEDNTALEVFLASKLT